MAEYMPNTNDVREVSANGKTQIYVTGRSGEMFLKGDSIDPKSVR